MVMDLLLLSRPASLAIRPRGRTPHTIMNCTHERGSSDENNNRRTIALPTVRKDADKFGSFHVTKFAKKQLLDILIKKSCQKWQK